MTKWFKYSALILAFIPLYSAKEIDSIQKLMQKFPDKRTDEAIVDFDLTNVDLSGWTFVNAVFKQESLANTNFIAATLIGKPGRCVFIKNLSCAIFQNARLENVTFLGKVIDCNFEHAHLKNVKFRDEVAECNFSNATLETVIFKQDIVNNEAINTKLINCINKDGVLMESKYGRLSNFITQKEEDKSEEK